MVEQFLKLKATEMWGLGNRNVGFGQPKCGVSALGEFFEKQPKCGVWATIFKKWLLYQDGSSII